MVSIVCCEQFTVCSPVTARRALHVTTCSPFRLLCPSGGIVPRLTSFPSVVDKSPTLKLTLYLDMYSGGTWFESFPRHCYPH